MYKNREKYYYCPLDMGERALIMPDGQIKVCAFTIGTNECVARYNENAIFLEKDCNEINKRGTLNENSVCYNQIMDYGSIIPLCMSYKPHQSEIVWNDINNKKK